MKTTIRNFQNFQKIFPTEDVCLEYVFDKTSSRVCAACRRGRQHRVSGRKCYACSRCGRQTHPLAGTIFEKSSTPLSLWFYAIFIIARAEKPVSARDLENHLGVTYKTAWRMKKNIDARTKSRQNESGDDLEGFWILLGEIVSS